MKVQLTFMFESSGNWWTSIHVANDECKGVLDTDNYTEIGFGQGVQQAIHKTAELRRTLGTGQKLLDSDEAGILVERGVFSHSAIELMYKDIEWMFHDF